MIQASTMLKVFVLSLLAIACSGSPIDQDESAGQPELILQYKQVASEYFGHYPPQVDPNNYDAKYVKFNLYTWEAPTKRELVLNNLETLRRSSYDVKKETKILIHSWLWTEEDVNELVSAYLRDHDRYLNVITVSFDNYTAAEYEDFIKVYGRIGESIGQFMKMLYQYGSHVDNMHLIGFGFGAHIAAAASKHMYPMKPGRITGLDPIGLDFDKDSSLVQLESKDADIVDIITTNMKGIGSSKPRGTIRFFPNGGVTQPGFSANPLGPSGSIMNTETFYSHIKAYYYFVESTYRECPFKAMRSTEYDKYLQGEYTQVDVCMGEHMHRRAAGNYFVKTNPVPPYGQNNESDQTTTLMPNAPVTELLDSLSSAENLESDGPSKKIEFYRRGRGARKNHFSASVKMPPIWHRTL